MLYSLIFKYVFPIVEYFNFFIIVLKNDTIFKLGLTDQCKYLLFDKFGLLNGIRILFFIANCEISNKTFF